MKGKSKGLESYSGKPSTFSRSSPDNKLALVADAVVEYSRRAFERNFGLSLPLSPPNRVLSYPVRSRPLVASLSVSAQCASGRDNCQARCQFDVALVN